jgi:hypothetical protein
MHHQPALQSPRLFHPHSLARCYPFFYPYKCIATCTTLQSMPDKIIFISPALLPSRLFTLWLPFHHHHHQLGPPSLTFAFTPPVHPAVDARQNNFHRTNSSTPTLFRSVTPFSPGNSNTSQPNDSLQGPSLYSRRRHVYSRRIFDPERRGRQSI